MKINTTTLSNLLNFIGAEALRAPETRSTQRQRFLLQSSKQRSCDFFPLSAPLSPKKDAFLETPCSSSALMKFALIGIAA